MPRTSSKRKMANARSKTDGLPPQLGWPAPGASDEIFRLFLEHAPAAIAMFDRKMRYLLASRRWLEDYRLSDHDIIGRSHYEIFPEIPERWKQIHQRCLRGAVESCEEEPFPRQDGTVDWVRWEVRPWRDQGGEVGGLLIFTEVVTERKRATEDVRRLNAELEERVKHRTRQLEVANEELEAFAYTAAHDLRAQLITVSGFSSMLLADHASSLPGDAQSHLHAVVGAAQKMSSLIDDLLTFSRLGRQPIKDLPIALAEIAQEALAELTGAGTEGKGSIRIGDLPQVQADPALLKQVLVNLLSNALKFTRHRGDAVIEVGWRKDLNDSAHHTCFVKDNGVGFDMQYVDKLFRVFQRLHRAEEYEGTGVGLAIVARIVRRHGGRVWAEGELGKGATFYFTLPKGGAA